VEQANSFLRSIGCLILYLYIYRIHGPKLYIKNEKEKGIGSDFGGGGGQLPPLAPVWLRHCLEQRKIYAAHRDG
jgi:hypothetical protein